MHWYYSLLRSGVNMLLKPPRWLKKLSFTWIIIFLICFMFLISPITWGTEIEPSISSSIDSEDAQSQGRSSTRAITLDWAMFGKDKSHSNLAGTVPRGIFEPSQKWDHWQTYINGNSIDSWGMTIGNFSNNIVGEYDRDVEHVVYAEDGYINVVDGENGTDIWRLNVDQIDATPDNDLVFTTPTLGFLDNNNELDIIFGSTDGILYMYEPVINYNAATGYSWSPNNVNDENVWEFNTSENFTFSSPVLDKLDSDSFLDVVVGAGDKLFAVAGDDGSHLWNKTLQGNIISSPVVYEDGTRKRVLATSFQQSNWNFSASFFEGDTGNSLDVLYFDLGLTTKTVNQLSSPAVAELDQVVDNKELIICTPFEGLLGNGKVYVYFTNRTLFWSTADNAIIGQIDATPAVGDLDGDGISEIVVVSWSQGTLGPVTHVYTFHGNNGSQMWHVVKDTIGVPQPPYTNERAVASPIIADLNDDDKLDVLFATSPNLFAVDGKNGTDLWQFPLTGTGRQLWSSPAASDIDNDGFLDVVLDGAAISHVIIDLTLSPADLYLSSENITENKKVNIHAIVHNTGSAAAEDVKASFFENDELIGNKTKNQIPADESREMIMEWIPTVEGTRTIKVVLDPDGDIEEINEFNNELSMEVTVLPSYPDLVIDSVQYFRGDGAQVDNLNTHLNEDEEATIKIFAENIGDDEALDVKIKALDSGTPIGTDKEIALINMHEIRNVTYSWQPSDPGSYELTFQISMRNASEEINLTNNEYKDQITVNDKDPADPKFTCRGTVYQPDNITATVGIEVRFTNNRTGAQKTTITNSTGHYSVDLSAAPSAIKYREGDEIIIYATDGENATSFSFQIYSEDRVRFDNITLVKVPTYAISIAVDDASKEILPNDEVDYMLTITNRGNEPNTVNLSLSDIIDVHTNDIPPNWTASLNQYILPNIPSKESRQAILTIEAPAKRTEARAKDQVLTAVTARSAMDSKQMDIVGMTTTVSRIYEFSIEMDKSTYNLDPLDELSIQVSAKIKNNGNSDDTINIALVVPDEWLAEYNSSMDLLLGEEKSFDALLTTDEFVSASEHTFRINVSSIDNKGNTSKKFTVDVLRPDLAFLGNVNMSPNNPKLSSPISFEARIRNNGTGAAKMFLVEFRIKGSVHDTKQVFNLTTGSETRVYFNWTPTSIGKYLLEFELDPYQNLIEISRDNNIETIQLDFYFDLALLDTPKFSNTGPNEGDKITISVTIENIGNVDITDSFTVNFYDGDPQLDGKRFESYFVTDDIPVEREIDISINWVVTGGSKEHTIYVEANPDHDFEEIDYENNIVYKSILVAKKPTGDEDYSLFIIIIFIVAIILIIFLILAPSKQVPGKEKGEAKPDKAGKTPEPKAKAAKGRKDKEAEAKKPELKKKGKPGAIVSGADEGVKFKVVGEEEGVAEGEEVEERVEKPGEVEEELESVAEQPEEEERGIREKGKEIGKSVSQRFGTLISGRWLPVSKTESKLEAEAIPEEEVVEGEVENEELEEIEELTEVAPPVDEEEIAEVEVVGEEPVDELEPEEITEMEVEALDEFEGEVEEVSELEEDEGTKDRKGKRKKDSDMDYSYMIGIR